jgi:hypothetical protein
MLDGRIVADEATQVSAAPAGGTEELQRSKT